MSTTPIDRTLEESREAVEETGIDLERTIRLVMADGVITPHEAGQLGVSLVEHQHALDGHRIVVAEVAGTVRAMRTLAHAGASSTWLGRKLAEHGRDMAALAGTGRR